MKWNIVFTKFWSICRYAYFTNSFKNCTKYFRGVQERSNDWKYVVPCKSINKDTQMLLILLCKNAFMGYHFCVKRQVESLIQSNLFYKTFHCILSLNLFLYVMSKIKLTKWTTPFSLIIRIYTCSIQLFINMHTQTHTHTL